MSGVSLTHWPAPFMPSTVPSVNSRQLFTPTGGALFSAVHVPAAFETFVIKNPLKTICRKYNRLKRQMLLFIVKLVLIVSKLRVNHPIKDAAACRVDWQNHLVGGGRIGDIHP